jgi:hypothetical protein
MYSTFLLAEDTAPSLFTAFLDGKDFSSHKWSWLRLRLGCSEWLRQHAPLCPLYVTQEGTLTQQLALAYLPSTVDTHTETAAVHVPWVPARNVDLLIGFVSPPPSVEQRPLVDQSLIVIETSRSHSDTQHSVVLRWTSDQSDTGTSTWQHTTFTRDIHVCGGIRTYSPRKRAAARLLVSSLISYPTTEKWLATEVYSLIESLPHFAAVFGVLRRRQSRHYLIVSWLWNCGVKNGR